MAGLSMRFTKQGYTLPKYMLFAGKDSLFRIAVSSFKSQFETARFVFLYRNIFDTKTFIIAECQQMGINNFELIDKYESYLSSYYSFLFLVYSPFYQLK